MNQPTGASTTVDLNNCDREPIHVPGAIQPHGCLLAYSADELELIAYSANAAEWFGRELSFGEKPADAFTPEFEDALRASVDSGSGGVIHHISYEASNRGAPSASAATHRHAGRVLVELEHPEVKRAQPDLLTSLPLRLNLVNQRLQACSGVDELYETIASEVRDVSGYDRVMVYRFLEEGHGAVVGEAVDDRFEPFLGLHYPATDIPQPARRLYLLNTVRSIADIQAAPVTIVHDAQAGSEPLDLSYSCFRAVSPIHIEYLQNMGVRASMSISIIDNGKLWGLIACHHYEPRFLTFEERAACEMIGLTAGAYLTARERDRLNGILASRRSAHARIMRDLAAASQFNESLMSACQSLGGLVEADGVALCWSGGPTLWGDTPELPVVKQLMASQLVGRDSVSKIHSLVDELGLDRQDLNASRGLLAAPLTAPDLKGLLFFRNEYLREVSWGGDPNKAKERSPDGVRLSPRLSFEKWSETVKDRSRDWSAADLEIAEDIRGGMVELLGRRAAQLATMNAELSRLNEDLDSFAYASSHDLREPLRGLNHNVYLLKEEMASAGEQLPGVLKRCAAIEQLSRRMDELVIGLLRISRAGRGDLDVEPLELSGVVDDALAMAWESGRPAGLRISVEDDSGPIRADYVGFREVLANLIANAAKYNDKESKAVVVRSHRGTNRRTLAGLAPVIIEVEDNGVGIPSDQTSRVFEVFRRLPSAAEFGEGTGAGLAIVKKIVQRHGGEVWVESQPGLGSKFCFTLEPSS